jgi:hypothetical protein
MKKNSKPSSPPEVCFCDLACGRVTVLPTESVDRLQAIIQELDDQFHPATPPEQFLAAQAIEARWNGERSRRLLNLAYSRLAAGNDSDSAILETLQTPNNILVKLERSIAASDRAFAKAVRELSRLRTATQKAEKEANEKAAGDWLESELRKVGNLPFSADLAPWPPETPVDSDLAFVAGYEPNAEKVETKLPVPHPGERTFCGGM